MVQAKTIKGHSVTNYRAKKFGHFTPVPKADCWHINFLGHRCMK